MSRLCSIARPSLVGPTLTPTAKRAFPVLSRYCTADTPSASFCPTTLGLSGSRSFKSFSQLEFVPRARQVVSPLHQNFVLDERITQAGSLVDVVTKNPDSTSSVTKGVYFGSLLSRIDRTTNHVVQLRPGKFNPETSVFEHPFVQVVPIRELRMKLLKKEENEKAQKKMIASSKEITVSWNIDDTDLARSCDRLENFLTEGRQVQVTVATRARKREAVPVEKQRAVVMALRERAIATPGASEFRQPEAGEARGGNPTVIMYFKGTAQKCEAKPDQPELTDEILDKIRRAEEKNQMRLARKQTKAHSQQRAQVQKKELFDNRPAPVNPPNRGYERAPRLNIARPSHAVQYTSY